MFSIAIIISFILITFFASISIMCFNTDFYRYEYAKNNVAEKINISDNDLMKATDVLLGYIKNSNDSLDVDVKIGDNIEKMFNQREIDHMVDVKNLYQKALKVMYVSIGAAMGILFYFLLFEKRYLSFLTRGFLRVLYTVLMLLSFFGIWIFTDFTSFWNWLHTLLFTNDLWLLDPRTSFMINMLPEIIFNQLVLAIVFYLILFIVPLTIFSIYYQIKKAPIGFENS